MPAMRKYWGVGSPLPAQIIMAQARQMEAMGPEGVVAPMGSGGR